MNKLKRMTRNEWMETNELKSINELKWRNWFERIELNEWNDWIEMNELTWMNWHECIETNDLTWMNWNEWLKRNELPKVLRNPQFLTIFMSNRALATVSCTFCRPLSGSRRATAQTKTLQGRPRTATLPEKNGFCARECFQPWIHVFPICHTSQLLDDDDIMIDMMIEMMMWLPCWWDS